MEPNFEYTYEMLEEDVRRLANQIKANAAEFDLIIGVARGGLLPAVRLSHMLGIPMLAVNYSLKDEHRHFTFNNELKSVKGLQTKRILLVEDLCDSGKTLEEMCDAHLFGLSVATCVPLYKPHTSCIKPDFYARTYEGNGWVDFAWEKK